MRVMFVRDEYNFAGTISSPIHVGVAVAPEPLRWGDLTVPARNRSSKRSCTRGCSRAGLRLRDMDDLTRSRSSGTCGTTCAMANGARTLQSSCSVASRRTTGLETDDGAAPLLHRDHLGHFGIFRKCCRESAGAAYCWGVPVPSSKSHGSLGQRIRRQIPCGFSRSHLHHDAPPPRGTIPPTSTAGGVHRSKNLTLISIIGKRCVAAGILGVCCALRVHGPRAAVRHVVPDRGAHPHCARHQPRLAFQSMQSTQCRA